MLLRSPRSQRLIIGLLVVLVLFSATTPVAAAQESPVDPDSVHLRASLQPDGSADWTVEYRIRIDDANTSDAFDSLQADIRANRSAFESRFADRMRPTVNAAENATGRSMTIEAVGVTTGRQTLGQEYGVITYTFEWTRFAVVDGSRIVAGDALAGLFLDEETSLTITWPEPYRAVTIRPSPSGTDTRAVTWEGRMDFASDEPVVVVDEQVTKTPGPGTTTAGTGPIDGGDGDGAEPSDGGDGWLSTALIAVTAVAIIAALGGGAWFYTRRRGRPSETPTDDTAATGATEPPPDLLSNEERVLQLLSERGGRIKQQQVAEELDWTDAKTSQVVSNLREDDAINSFRLGRENVLTLPDHDLTESAEDDDQ